MHDWKKDKEATKLARRYRVFASRDSYISNNGHVYLAGIDKTNLRNQVMLDANFRCAICGDFCSKYEGNMHHKKGGLTKERCDCYNNQLPEGKICSNVEWICGMFSKNGCHRKIHNREVKWTPKSM